MTFYKDFQIILVLVAAFMLHIAAAIGIYLIKKPRAIKILSTVSVCLNIALHLIFIVMLMYKAIPLEEAVLVFMVSVFFYTLASFVAYRIRILLNERDNGEGGEAL